VTERPNVVLPISHDTGRFISPHGIDTVHTPSFERLAEESVLFENAFCTAPQCSPSRAALVTSRIHMPTVSWVSPMMTMPGVCTARNSQWPSSSAQRATRRGCWGCRTKHAMLRCSDLIL
jgi:arylsulfatase A-like enzyme